MRKSKMSKKSALKKNFLTVILLALAGSIIYGLPYYRFYYYDSYMQLYHLSNVQIGLLGSAYGFLGMLSYLLGGVMADKFNAKKMVIFSLIATGACGFLHLITGQFYVLLAIYAIWGLTSLLTFWPACVCRETLRSRAVHMESSKEREELLMPDIWQSQLRSSQYSRQNQCQPWESAVVFSSIL